MKTIIQGKAVTINLSRREKNPHKNKKTKEHKHLNRRASLKSIHENFDLLQLPMLH